MEENKKDDVQKTQIISPGAMGEEANRKKDKVVSGKESSVNSTAQEEGLNEEKSAGDAGAFEGLEDMER